MLRALLVLGVASCTHDVVYPPAPSDAVCGDGVLQSGEQCDVTSPGCTQCTIVPGYTCDKTGCSVICGDGVSGEGPSCDRPQKDEACDMTGYWAARETAFERDTVVNSVQVSSTWYLYRFSQAGDAFQVEEELNCGDHVSGSVTSDPTPAALRAMLYSNRQDAVSKHGPRKGTFKSVGGGCAYSLSRWYNVRGTTDDFLPADFSTLPPLSSLRPMPSEADPVHPTMQNTAGAIDFQGDGMIGFAQLITGFVSGTRHAAERDFTDYDTRPSEPISQHAIDFVVPGEYDLNESLLSVTDCGSACGLLAAAAFVAKDLTPRVTMHFVGKTLGSARVRAVVAGATHVDTGTDLATCANVRLLLPHDTSPTPP